MSDLYKEKARKLQKGTNCKMVNYKNSLIRECKPLFTVDEKFLLIKILISFVLITKSAFNLSMIILIYIDNLFICS